MRKKKTKLALQLYCSTATALSLRLSAVDMPHFDKELT